MKKKIEQNRNKCFCHRNEKKREITEDINIGFEEKYGGYGICKKTKSNKIRGENIKKKDVGRMSKHMERH